MRLLHGLIAFTALLGLTYGQQPLATRPPEQSLVDTWPTDMVIMVGQEGRINFTLKAGKAFDRVITQAVFIGKSQLETIYQATSSKQIIQPDFKEDFEAIPGSKHDLRIKSMVWTRAGMYIVTATDPDFINEDRQFTVGAIDDAKCILSKEEEIMEGDIIFMDCAVQYTGSKVPQMKWTDDTGANVPGFVVPVDNGGGDENDKTTPSPTAPKTVTYRANITASRTHDRRDFRCSLMFEDPITYTDNCSKSFGVSFAVSKMRFDPDPTPSIGRYKVGDTINCTAIGNPDPTFRWRGNTLNAPILQDGPTLRLTSEMVGGYNNFTCIAKNKVEQEVEIQRNLTFTVTHTPTSGAGQILMSMGLMWGLTFLLMVIIKLF